MSRREGGTRSGKTSSEERSREQENSQNGVIPETTGWDEKRKDMTSADKTMGDLATMRSEWSLSSW